MKSKEGKLAQKEDNLTGHKITETNTMLSLYFLKKEDFKSINKIYHTSLAIHLFDSLKLDYFFYVSNDKDEIDALGNNKFPDIEVTSEMFSLYLHLKTILEIEDNSNLSREDFLNSKDNLTLYILNIDDSGLRLNLVKGLIKFYKEETAKGKNHLRIKLLELERLFPELTPKKNIIEKPNLFIGGKKPNYSERYKIANDTLGLFTNINNRNISQTEKHILLAHILGCSQQVARELFNGTQQKRTPVREDMINKYLDTLN